MPDVAGADLDQAKPRPPHPQAPPISRMIRVQRRFGGRPLSGEEQPMELGGWVELADERPIDALAIAFFADALMPAPFMRLSEANPVPTVDLTVHFRVSLPRAGDPADAARRCLVRVRAGAIQEGFFDEDTVIWAPDGTLLAQSRQLGLFVGAGDRLVSSDA